MLRTSTRAVLTTLPPLTARFLPFLHHRFDTFVSVHASSLPVGVNPIMTGDAAVSLSSLRPPPHGRLPGTGSVENQLYASQRRFYYVDDNHYGKGETCQLWRGEKGSALPNCAGNPLTCTASNPLVCEKWAGYSVVAEPTRDAAMLPRFANITLMMRQPRRQAPGWDGCRDRTDGRDWLPNQLLWKAPKQRSDFSAVYSEKFKVLLFYGGFGFNDLTPHVNNVTEPSATMSDLWQYHITNCAKNCSLHGDCIMGGCYCHDGYVA
jgi:hypothetical protein